MRCLPRIFSDQPNIEAQTSDAAPGAKPLGYFFLVAEWIHFTLFGIMLPTIKLKVYTFGGL